MALKTGITNYSFARSLRGGQMDVEGFLDFCGKAGFDGVDLIAYFWKDKDREMAALPEWLQRNDLLLVGYGVGNNFLTHDAAELENAKQAVRDGIDDAHRIGCKMMRVFGGHGLEGWTTGGALAHMVECFKELVKPAADNDVVLTIENHGSFPAKAEEVIALIDEVDSPYLASLLDTGNFLGAGDDPLEAAKKLVPYVKHVHVKDMKTYPAGGEQGHKAKRADVNIAGCLIGEGVVPNREIFATLADAGYDGYLSIEAEGPQDASDEERVTAGLNYIRKAIEEIEN